MVSREIIGDNRELSSVRHEAFMRYADVADVVAGLLLVARSSRDMLTWQRSSRDMLK